MVDSEEAGEWEAGRKRAAKEAGDRAEAKEKDE